MAWLSLETGQGGMICEVGRMTTIGRGRMAALVVQDPCASQLHCAVEQRGAELWIRDSGSSNGTFVNGKLVRGETRLVHGDGIGIGATVLRVLERLTEEERRSVVVLHGAVRDARPSLSEMERTMVHTLAGAAAEAPDPGPSIENGQLLVGRGGDMRVQLWNVRITEGGVFVRIPLAGDRPPASWLHRYVGRSKHEHLVIDPGDTVFEALLAEARHKGRDLSERAQVDFLMRLVFDALGGLQTEAALQGLLTWCDAQGNRAVRIGELIERRAGACRHRAFLFFHLARRLGLRVELCRGTVADGRHAWNVVRVDGRRVFVDAAYGLVLDDARAAEQAQGYAVSRADVTRPDEPAQGRALIGGEGDVPELQSVRFHHELRKVPGDEEVLLLLYPERDMPEARQVHVRFHAGAQAAAMFAMEPFLAARVYAIVGDEAHHRMDAVDPAAMEKLRRAWQGRTDLS